MTQWSTALVHNRYVLFVGWTLLMMLWETSAIAALLATYRACIRRRRVRREYLAALCALALSCAAILVTLVWQVRGTTQSATWILHQSLAATSATSASILKTWLQRPAMDVIAAIAAVVWFVGTCALLVRAVGGWWIARSLIANARSMGDRAARRIAEGSAVRAEMAGRIAVVETAVVGAPAVVGWRAPTILMPRGVLERLSEGELSAVLAHEIAHVRRHDYAMNLVQSFIEVPLFLSPAVAWISRCIREAREFCCDEEAAASVADRRQYVQALLSLAAVQGSNRLYSAVGISGPPLVKRVRRLLEEDSMLRLSPVRIVALVGALVLIGVGGVQVSAVAALRVSRQADAIVYKPSDPGVTDPVPIHEVRAVYTDAAKKRKVQGTVEMEEVITSDGNVRDDIRVVKSLDPELDAQAIKAARQWQFRPATKDGKPVNVMVHIEMTFTLK